MSTIASGVRVQQRRDTAANWTTYNPVLLAGEIGIETDTHRMKVGNGTSNWSALPYTTIPMDTSPTSGSSNAITSGGVSTALAQKQDKLTAGTGITMAGNTINWAGLKGPFTVLSAVPPAPTANDPSLIVVDGQLYYMYDDGTQALFLSDIGNDLTPEQEAIFANMIAEQDRPGAQPQAKNSDGQMIDVCKVNHSWQVLQKSKFYISDKESISTIIAGLTEAGVEVANAAGEKSLVPPVSLYDKAEFYYKDFKYFTTEEGEKFYWTEQDFLKYPVYPRQVMFLNIEFVDALEAITGEIDTVTTYAPWVICTIHFQSEFGTAPEDIVDTRNLPDPLPTMEAVEGEGYEFGGWYLDPEFTQAAVAGDPITTSVTLYAKWIEKVVEGEGTEGEGGKEEGEAQPPEGTEDGKDPAQGEGSKEDGEIPPTEEDKAPAGSEGTEDKGSVEEDQAPAEENKDPTEETQPVEGTEDKVEGEETTTSPVEETPTEEGKGEEAPITEPTK